MNARKIICVLLLAALALCTAVPALAVSETDTPVQTYTVAYDAAGGMRVPEAQTKQHGVDLVLDDLWPVHPNGYMFSYYRSAQGETYLPGGVFSPDSGTTLTASWDDGLYQIVYDANGGLGAPFVQTQFMGESVTLRTDTPTREGYEFLGWSRSSSAKTAEFRPGGTYTHDGGCGILYAVWVLPEQRTYTVTYHPNGGYDEPSPQTKRHGVDLTLSKYAAVRPGFEFAGWATEQGGKAVYQKSSVYTLDADITLYAVWADVLEITTQPADTSVHEGELVSVSVAASGEGLSYQWYVAMAGSDTFSRSSVKKSTYSTVMDESRDGRRVYCVVTDEHGCTVTSDTVTIGMKTRLAITRQPENASAASGKRVEVSVTAAGDGLTYQWYVAVTSADSFIKSSITKSTYGTTMDESRSGRRVYCVVTDAYGNSVRSDTVTISMKSTVAVTKQPVSASAAEGERVNVTVTAAGEGLTYQWYVAMAGSDSFSKSSVKKSTYSTVMDESRDGRRVYCVITDKYGTSVRTDTVTIGMIKRLTLTSLPVSTSAASGKRVSLSVGAEGEGLKYQWYICLKGSTVFERSSVKSDTYSTVMDESRDGRRFYCVITDRYGNSVRTNTVTITLKK